MNDRMQAAMAEVTRLTRTGQLAKATEIIQRTLGSGSASGMSTTRPSSADTPIDAEVRIVDDAPPSTHTSVSGKTPRLGLPPRSAWSRPAKGGVRPGRPEVVSSSAHAGGQFVERVYTTTGGTRSYKLYIPSGYTGQAVPLVVMLHGCTQTSVDFAVGTRMNVLAEGKVFLVAYPQQAISANGSKCWNWFQAADQQHGRGEPSLIAGITQQIMCQYHVDANRVYVAGLSSGGAMAAIMAATYPDLYAAVGVHSGLAYGAAQDLPSAFAAMKQGTPQRTQLPNRVIPLIVFHGDHDRTVAPINADHVIEQWLQIADDETNAMHRSVRSVTVEPGQLVGGYAYTRYIYHDSRGQAIMEKWVVHQAGHAWSGGSSSGSYTDPKGPDASVEMVRFFTEHPRRR